MQILLSNNFFYHTRHEVLQLDSSIKCSLFKNTLLQPIIYDYYIRKPEPIKYQKYIPRFRLSMQQLAIIETGRSDNCEQQNRKCFLCSYFVENKSYLNMSFKRSITLTHQKKNLQCRNYCGILMLKMLKMYVLGLFCSTLDLN